MLEEMSAPEFKRWQIYEAHEPFGDRLVASTLANSFSKADAKWIHPWHFLTMLAPVEDPQVVVKRTQTLLQITMKAQQILKERQEKRKVNRQAERQAKQAAAREQVKNARVNRRGRDNSQRDKVQRRPSKS